MRSARHEIDGAVVPEKGRAELSLTQNTHLHQGTRNTHPLLAVNILWRSRRHPSQKYSSGLDSSVMMPTQAPCCQTLQTSHCTKKPADSSVTSVGKAASMSVDSLRTVFISSSRGGGPG